MVYKDFRFCFIKTLEEILMSEKETGREDYQQGASFQAGRGGHVSLSHKQVGCYS